jgi:predicted ATPase/DNA-binding CsgD family transcriptional regulator
MERQTTADQPPTEPIPLHDRSNAARSGASNLPAPLTSLIGREKELAAAIAMLQREYVRLITFTGPGGVGKTQLALEVAREASEDLADGAVFVPLAPLRDPAHVSASIAHEFDVRESDPRLLLDRLQVALRARELLLVLDNFEHVTEAASLLTDLLTVCPRLKILVTSRELLHLTGEHAFEVPSLELPDSTQSLPIDELASCDAIRLFVMRAQEAKTNFALTEANAEAVADICRSLDGLPLALELAAARTRVLAPAALLAQLSNRLQLLTGGHRDAPERLQTMRHAIAWSYDLLAPDEQRLFRRLAVFVGGFTLDGAEAVGAETSVLDLFTSLVDKSLVRQLGQPDGETRFSMLEAVREFGLEQLAASGEEEATRDAHAAAFVALAEAALPHYGGDRWLEWMDKVEADLANCHAALEWADAHGDADTVARLAGALWRPEFARGDPSDAGRWLERALAMRHDVSPTALIDVLEGAACFYAFLVDDSARAQALSSELISLADEVGDAYGAGAGNIFLGMLALRRSEYAEATAHYRQALALAPAGRSPAAEMADAIFNLARVAFHQGDLIAAADGFANALARNREIGFLWGIMEALSQLGQVRLAQGNTKDAAAMMAEALQLAWDLRETGGMAGSLEDLAVVAFATGQVQEAAHLTGAVNALRLRYGLNPELSCSADATQATLDARRAMGDEAFDAAHAAGEKMSLEEATQLAFAVAAAAGAGPPPSDSTAGHDLTSRELEVLRLLVEGQSDKDIAEALGITRRTASKHVETIRAKFDVSSRTAAVAYANSHGII